MLDNKLTNVATWAFLGGACLLAQSASAVVLHPNQQNLDDAVPAGSHPADAVIGRWGTDASAVAIASDTIITTRHQAASSTVTFNGVVYSIVSETPIGNVDARVVKVTIDGTHPGLTFVPLYTGNDLSQSFVLGGYGVGRGTNRTATINGTYGYDWGTNDNNTLRWGANVTGATAQSGVTANTPYTSDVLTADFDRAGGATSVAHEGIISDHDSGGGWFILDAGVWKLAGLNAYIGHAGFTPDPSGLSNTNEPVRSSLFASHTDASVNLPDGMDAIRISTYAAQINAAVPEPASIGLIVAGAALAFRRRR